MKRAEIILSTLALCGLVIKILHLEGADLLLLISLAGLSCLYFYFAVGLLNGVGLRPMFKSGAFKGVPGIQIVTAIVTGVALSIFVIAFLFAVLHFAGALIMHYASIFLLMVALILVIAFKQKFVAGFSRAVFIRLIGVAIFLGLQFVSVYLL